MWLLLIIGPLIVLILLAALLSHIEDPEEVGEEEAQKTGERRSS